MLLLFVHKLFEILSSAKLAKNQRHSIERGSFLPQEHHDLNIFLVLVIRFRFDPNSLPGQRYLLPNSRHPFWSEGSNGHLVQLKLFSDGIIFAAAHDEYVPDPLRIEF